MTKNNNSKSQFDEQKSWGKYGNSLYKYWVDTYGNQYVNRWLKKHKYNIDSCETKEFIEYMTDNFIKWIIRDK